MRGNPAARSRVLAGLILLALGVEGMAYARDDWQFWHGYEIKQKWNDDFSFKMTGEQRLTDDFSNSTLFNISPGFLWHPSKYFEIGPFFKYERSRTARGDHVNERRWLLEATLKGKVGAFKLSDRNRIAYRDRSTTDEWRYRNRVKLSWPLPFKALPLEPFISEEIFWQWNEGSLNQNRVQAGLTVGLNPHTSLSLYYMLRSDRRGSDWDESHVLGTALGLSF